jgi:hypothetical protein
MIRPKCHSHSANLTDSHSANLTTPITREYQRLLSEITCYTRRQRRFTPCLSRSERGSK